MEVAPPCAAGNVKSSTEDFMGIGSEYLSDILVSIFINIMRPNIQ